MTLYLLFARLSRNGLADWLQIFGRVA